MLLDIYVYGLDTVINSSLKIVINYDFLLCVCVTLDSAESYSLGSHIPFMLVLSRFSQLTSDADLIIVFLYRTPDIMDVVLLMGHSKESDTSPVQMTMAFFCHWLQ